MHTPFTHPLTHAPLHREADRLIDPDGHVVAEYLEGIPRFVTSDPAVVRSFAWQWRRWGHHMKDSTHAAGRHRALVMARTGFESMDLRGKTVLECGCGSGNDTEVLLSLPFSAVHSFDYSTSVAHVAEACRADVDSGRLTLSQADINRIPYADGSFDVVFCHRVLQHTPDPAASLRSICRKVKQGGVLFAHCYRRSPLFMSSYKYKYRVLTRRLPAPVVACALDVLGPMLHALNSRLCARSARGKRCVYRWVPFQHSHGLWSYMGPRGEIEQEKLITFDALTPRFDNPMTTEEFRRIIESEGFSLDRFKDNPEDALFCTARKTSVSVSLPARTPMTAA